MQKRLFAITAVTVQFLPTLALAHPGHGSAVEGFLHPFTGIDHLLALVMLGAFAAQVGRGRAFAAVASFLALFTAGFLAARTGLTFPAQEQMLAASLVGLGGLAFLGRRAPFGMALAVTALFATFHGAAHGQELDAAAFSVALPGFFFACLLLIGGSYAVFRRLENIRHLPVLRFGEAAGTLSMLTGLLFLASA